MRFRGRDAPINVEAFIFERKSDTSSVFAASICSTGFSIRSSDSGKAVAATTSSFWALVLAILNSLAIYSKRAHAAVIASSEIANKKTMNTGFMGAGHTYAALVGRQNAVSSNIILVSAANCVLAAIQLKPQIQARDVTNSIFRVAKGLLLGNRTL